MNFKLCFLFLILKINDFSEASYDVDKPKHPPYLVVIMEEDGNFHDFHCIGILISFSQVLTTGSCVRNGLNGMQILPLNYLSSLNSEEVTRTVSKIISQHDQNKIEPIERLVVLEFSNAYSENEDLKPVVLTNNAVLTDAATEYRVVTATLEEKANPRYNLLHQEEQYYKHLQDSREKNVTRVVRSEETSNAAPLDKSSLQETLVIEDAHPHLTLYISSVLTKTSKECDNLVKEYFNLTENNHKIICSEYSKFPGVCKKDYGVPLVDGDTLVGILTYIKSECGDPSMYLAIHKDNEFLECARMCQKELCEHCQNVMPVSDVRVHVVGRAASASNELRSGGDDLGDCLEQKAADLASSTSKSSSSSMFKMTYHSNNGTNPQLIFITVLSTTLYLLKQIII